MVERRRDGQRERYRILEISRERERDQAGYASMHYTKQSKYLAPDGCVVGEY